MSIDRVQLYAHLAHLVLGRRLQDSRDEVGRIANAAVGAQTVARLQRGIQNPNPELWTHVTRIMSPEGRVIPAQLVAGSVAAWPACRLHQRQSGREVWPACAADGSSPSPPLKYTGRFWNHKGPAWMTLLSFANSQLAAARNNVAACSTCHFRKSESQKASANEDSSSPSHSSSATETHSEGQAHAGTASGRG